MNPKYTMRLRYPASWWSARWRDAMPTGNGKIGASVYGGVYRETILLSHEELWARFDQPVVPDVSDVLPHIRVLLREGRAPEAQSVMTEALTARGFKAGWPFPFPLGDLTIVTPDLPSFTKYERTLDLETGEVTVRWSAGNVRYERSLFVSRTADLIVYEIRASAPGAITIRASLDLHDRRDAARPESLPIQAETIASNDMIRYAARNDDGTDFGAVARLMAENGTVQVKGGELRVENADQVTIVMKPFIKGDRHSAWTALQQELEMVDCEYDALFAPHVAANRSLFNRVHLDLGASEGDHALSNEEMLLRAYDGETSAAMVERMWAFGRHLLIATNHVGGLPCPLLGLFIGEYDGFWSFNMTNVNLQMIYWQALSGNLPELLTPVFDYCDGMLDDLRVNAQRLYGCRGIHLPAVSMPGSGLIRTSQPHILYFTAAAGWVGQHYYDYFLHTGDEAFLRERALPFLREIALFYEDFLQIGQDGRYMTAPANSPENSPANYWDGREGEGNMQATVSPTMDMAIVKEVLTNLIAGSRRLGVYPDEVATWAEMLTRLPPYRVNREGALAEWIDPAYDDNYRHRHASGAYPLFPGLEITSEETPELFAAAAVAAAKRHDLGLKHASSWGLAYSAGTFARLGEGDRALDCLDLISRTCLVNNFFTLHNDWRDMGITIDLPHAPFQIDANMGWTSAVHEMLLFSKPGILKILPALPSRWTKGSVSGLLARGGIVIATSWDTNAGTAEASLVSGSEQTVQIKNPGFDDALRCRAATGSIAPCSRGANWVEVSLSAGEPVQLSWGK